MFALSYLVLAVMSPVPEYIPRPANPVCEPERKVTRLVANSSRSSSSRSSSSRSREGEEASEDTVYVALGKDDKENNSIITWTLEHFKGKKLFIIHVLKPTLLITTQMGAKLPEGSVTKQEVDAYRKSEEQKVEKVLKEYLLICRKKVQAEKQYIRHKSIEKGIMELISQHKIRNLVMGAAGERHRYWKVTEVKSKKARYVRENSPSDSCQVWFVYRGKEVIYTRKLDGGLAEAQSPSQCMDTTTEPIQSPKLKSPSKKMKMECLKNSSSIKFFPCCEDGNSNNSVDITIEESRHIYMAQHKPPTILRPTAAGCSYYCKDESSVLTDMEENFSLDEERIMANVHFLIDKPGKELGVTSYCVDGISAPSEIDFANAKEILADFLNQNLKNAAENPNKEKIASAALLLSQIPEISPERKSFLLSFANELNHTASSFSISSASYSQASQNLKAMQEAKDQIFETRHEFQKVETSISESSKEFDSLASEIGKLEETLAGLKTKQENENRKIGELRNERKQYVIKLKKQSSVIAESEKMVDEWRSTEESTSLHLVSLAEIWNKWKTHLKF
ncbi:hypothetical protein ACFE04_026302 [Oxalis oulophora]